MAKRIIVSTVFILAAAVSVAASPKYRDARPAATMRMDATDHGVVLRYGDGPGKCDTLGARDVWVFEDRRTYYMHYDAAGPKGWLTSLAVSKDLLKWEKKGPVLDFGKPGEDDSKGACYGVTYRDGKQWHMFYLGTPNVTAPPNLIPGFPYLTLKARAKGPAGPWIKQKNVVPFRTKPGTYYSITASPGQVIKHGDEYLQFFSSTTRKPGNPCVQRTLGIARTKNLDGPWTVDPKPMVPIEEQIENSAIYYEKSNKTWFLFTNHIGIDRGEYTDAIWVYWSKDLNKWDPKNKAVVLDGKNCSWSKKCIGLPSVVQVGKKLALFYDAPGGNSTSHMKRHVGLAWLGLPLSPPALVAEKKVKVFILAGQSNMEGHGQVRSLPHLGNHPKYGHLLKKLKSPDGKWVVRDDVTISYKAEQRKVRSGPLTVGWGSEKHELGPELMFGTIMGEMYDEPVLLIKTAWGGKDVICDFRSPSAGKPSGAEAAYFAHRKKQGDTRQTGVYYRKMVSEIKETLDDIKNVVPGYKGQGYEIAGMAWFQGWNDIGAWHFQQDGKHLGKEVLWRYKHNLSAMIRDLRKDLGAANMPVVIGELGVGGHEMTKKAQAKGRDWEAESIVELRRIQKAIGDDPKIKNVTFAATLDYWDVRLQELRVISNAYYNKKYKAGIKDTEENHLPTKELNDEFLRLGQHWFCHYNGSVANYCLIGWAMAEALNKPSAEVKKAAE